MTCLLVRYCALAISIGKIAFAHIIIFSAGGALAAILESPASRATARLVPSDDAAEIACYRRPNRGCEMIQAEPEREPRSRVSPSLEKREQHNFGETATKITTLGLSLSRHTKTRRSRWRCSCRCQGWRSGSGANRREDNRGERSFFDFFRRKPNDEQPGRRTHSSGLKNSRRKSGF